MCSLQWANKEQLFRLQSDLLLFAGASKEWLADAQGAVFSIQGKSVNHTSVYLHTDYLPFTPHQICVNEQYGRYLIATKNIKAGQIVLQEKPLVCGPSQLSPVVCVGCLKVSYI